MANVQVVGAGLALLGMEQDAAPATDKQIGRNSVAWHLVNPAQVTIVASRHFLPF